MGIRTRLISLVAVLGCAMMMLGGIGLYIANHAEGEIQSIFEHQTLPMRELARIRRLMVENSGQIFRAIQHNPTFEYVKLHDHPVSLHTDIIEKNLKWMDETLVSFKGHLVPDSEEARLLAEFTPLYQQYISEVIQPTLASIRAGDYSNAVVARFLKYNGAFEGKINPMMRSIAEAQEKAVKNSYETAKAKYGQQRWLAVSALIAGLLIGVVVAVMTIRSITGPLGEMQRIITHAAKTKDFTGSIHITSHDEVAATSKEFNHLMGVLRQSLSDVRNGIASVDDATSQLDEAARNAAEASVSTSEAASSMAASVEELSVSITSVADHSREALAMANEAGEHSETGGKVIGDAVAALVEIAEQVRVVGDSIDELGQHSDRISSVVQVIKDVADQTNLLALNAAIEAARAGEQGRGFAVVADEVRKLAERTSQATGEIALMIGSIQSSSHVAVSKMDSVIQSIESGSELASKAGEALESIRQATSQVQAAFADINEAVAEQGAASYDIAQRVERVAQASEQSTESVRFSAEEASRIRALANQMRATVNSFKV
ncbi:methyl-accepting chemotaxis protein [Azonexus sp. IMCC34839]|uniref:HAMP domain-containing methyl-accepting chemotaxis protein n=1 Tax=Azonexus sp. IMCC34839 TaxID=3133695 RepID=UPI00399AA8E9